MARHAYLDFETDSSKTEASIAYFFGEAEGKGIQYRLYVITPRLAYTEGQA